MDSFKVPNPAPEGLTLRRWSWLARTVRYEWTGPDGQVLHCPPFQATSQEWERAHE